MKKLALALVIGLGVFIVISASASSLAARRAADTSGVAANGDSRIESSVTAAERRLLMLDQALYPETAADSAITDSQLAHRQGERATTDTSTTFTDSQLVYRQGEGGGAAQVDTTSTDTQRLFCDGDICIVP